MGRPSGRKPLSHTKIAEICARLVKGERVAAVARAFNVSRNTVNEFKIVLLREGVAPRYGGGLNLAEDLDSKIWELIRTTRMTNVEIRNDLHLSCTQIVRYRRDAHYAALRAARSPIPTCKCGRDFQHSGLCHFSRSRPKPVSPADVPAVIRALASGCSIGDAMDQFEIGQSAVVGLIRKLTPKQREKRNKGVSIRRSATKRRNKMAAKSEGMFERLDAKVSRDLPPDIRSETIQLMALAILDGKVSEAEAVKHPRRYSAQAFSQLGDRWRTVSIDEERDGLSLGDMIEDAGALEAFDRLDDLELADDWRS